MKPRLRISEAGTPVTCSTTFEIFPRDKLFLRVL
jgi:hypothetical protein